MTEENQRQILQLIDFHSCNTLGKLASQLAVSPDALRRQLKKLVENNVLHVKKIGRINHYELVQHIHRFSFNIGECSEDIAFMQTLHPLIKHLNQNVLDVFHYGFTEMFNNAIDHSEGTHIDVAISTTPIKTEVAIIDNGFGIFEKIQKAFHLLDIRQSIFELSKGKLTTDSSNHTGEGIFFSSKVFDRFSIFSKNWAFVHHDGVADILNEVHPEVSEGGTKVVFCLNHFSTKKLNDVFNRFAEPDEFVFASTIVPLHLAKYEGETLMSRSQAKRLTARFEHFQKVILDFQGVAMIGQGFADELFRVYKNNHPDVMMIPINMVEDVKMMISRILAAEIKK